MEIIPFITYLLISLIIVLVIVIILSYFFHKNPRQTKIDEEYKIRMQREKMRQYIQTHSVRSSTTRQSNSNRLITSKYSAPTFNYYKSNPDNQDNSKPNTKVTSKGNHNSKVESNGRFTILNNLHKTKTTQINSTSFERAYSNLKNSFDQ